MTDIIYFLRAADHVKIGKSATDAIDSRIAMIQTGSPHKLELLGVVYGGHKVERDLHSRFKRHRKHGEWFYFDHEIRDYIYTNASFPQDTPSAALSPDARSHFMRCRIFAQYELGLPRCNAIEKANDETAQRFGVDLLEEHAVTAESAAENLEPKTPEGESLTDVVMQIISKARNPITRREIAKSNRAFRVLPDNEKNDILKDLISEKRIKVADLSATVGRRTTRYTISEESQCP